MTTVLISVNGRITLPAKTRAALGLKPGMHVNVSVDGNCARLTPVPVKAPATLDEIQKLLKYEGPVVPISAMRMT